MCIRDRNNVSTLFTGQDSPANLSAHDNLQSQTLVKSESNTKSSLKEPKMSVSRVNGNVTGLSSFMQGTFEERLEYFKEKYKKNTDIAAMECLNETKIECTFAPMTNSRGKHNRTVQQFLKDQSDFLKQRDHRIKCIEQKKMAKELKEVQCIPKINKNTSSFIERKRSQPKDAKLSKVQEKENKQEAPTKQKNEHYLRSKLIKDVEDICGNKDYITSFEILCNRSNHLRVYTPIIRPSEK
eukprot:TRINITY_DN8465_c0_g2_i4.p1 TRINITY_DN8465_c0_g2~~TRINITY_DN8465_c0_g2_i4.p1  ORF type:complete len:255 (-),score=39.81 TRINITY_DN8465_c0_g2_i4:1095-1814(-)